MADVECLTDVGKRCYTKNIIGTESKQDGQFQAGDWAVLGVVLGISTIVGLYFAYVDRNKSADEYMVGGRKVPPIPIAMSLAATTFSAITILGTPVEFYSFGTMFMYFIITYLVCTIICTEIFAPMYMDFGFTSTYEYMEKRFSSSVKMMCTFIFVAQTTIYLGMVIYVPALSLETVTGLDRWAAVWITGGVCIFYTTIGGLKAVVWTDTIQLTIMISGFIGIIAQGVADHGFDTIRETFQLGGRNIWGDFMGDPRFRHTFWSIVLGGIFGTWGNNWCGNQSMVQRMLACKNRRDLRISLYTSWCLVALIMGLTCFTGMVLFQYFQCCDPIKAKWVGASDQLAPYLAVNLFQALPGVAGLYIAGAYSGTLSSVSSALNSMATVISTDFVKPYYHGTERFYLLLNKFSSIALGLIAIGFSYMASRLGGMLEASLSINSIIGANNFAIFVLAILNPWANYLGAHIGFLCGLGVSTWIYIGSKEYPTPARFTKFLPTESIGCENQDMFAAFNKSSYNDINPEWCAPVYDPTYEEESPEIANLYWISYMYMGTIGFITTFVVGSIVSLLTNRCIKHKPENLPKNVLLPCIDRMFPRHKEEVKNPYEDFENNSKEIQNPSFDPDDDISE